MVLFHLESLQDTEKSLAEEKGETLHCLSSSYQVKHFPWKCVKWVKLSSVTISVFLERNTISVSLLEMCLQSLLGFFSPWLVCQTSKILYKKMLVFEGKDDHEWFYHQSTGLIGNHLFCSPFFHWWLLCYSWYVWYVYKYARLCVLLDAAHGALSTSALL